ncbi:Rv1733c family protein [Streptomyces sp. NPDC002004]
MHGRTGGGAWAALGRVRRAVTHVVRAALTPPPQPPGEPIRWWRWRRNPLRRRCDVIEAWTALLLGLVLFIGVPVAAYVAGRVAYADGRATSAAQAAERHRIPARLTQDAPPLTPSEDGGQSRDRYHVAVSWTDPGGAAHTGTALVPAGAKTGDTADVWLDARGRPTSAPLTSDEIANRVIAAAGGTAMAVALATGATHLVVRRVAQRHRMAEWEQDWERTGPGWDSRTP